MTSDEQKCTISEDNNDKPVTPIKQNGTFSTGQEEEKTNATNDEDEFLNELD